MDKSESEKKYKRTAEERKICVDAILNSICTKKIVVAGPGTGKTFLFKKALEGKTNTLTLTFINALVDDLSLELYGISDVRTLHSFARSVLSKATNKEVNIYPKLSEIIKTDLKVLQGLEIDFDQIFYNKDEGNKNIDFYRQRRKYYDCYGYTDIIYAAVKYFEQNKNKIPTYEQIVVDEFQDFNILEVSLIDLLSEKSPVLLAGDDDQALYIFKSASPDHIRHRHGDKYPDYEAFNLPFCARCPKVVVEATNNLIDSAKNYKLLVGRIDKPYKYFDSHSKDIESSKYPQISYAQVFSAQMPWFIESKIKEIAEDTRSKFSVLIISPISIQASTIGKKLNEKGFNSVEFIDKKDNNYSLLIEGLRLLIEDIKNNLGWRLIAEAVLTEAEFESLLKKTNENNPKTVDQLIETKIKKDIKDLVKILKDIINGEKINRNDFESSLKKLSLDPYEISKSFLREEFRTENKHVDHAIKDISIKSTTIQSSKGLAADIVFVTHFDDEYFIKNPDKKIITDQDICNFLVALTRTKKKIFLISSKKKDPTFLKWIDQKNIERL